MKNFLLFALLVLFSTVAFTQSLKLTNELGQDIGNTTVTIDIKSSDITNDDSYEVEYKCDLNNVSAMKVTATIEKTLNDIPDGAESTFCALGSCTDPTQTSRTGDIEGNDKDSELLHYKPKGNTVDATIVYTYSYEGGSDDVTLTLKYHVIDDTNVPELAKDNNFMAYPNPANGQVNISFNTAEDAEIVIYNIVGKKVKTVLVSPGLKTVEIETSDLQAGTYFYSIISDTKLSGTKRLVIKH